jgi:sulfate permease, SulP family
MMMMLSGETRPLLDDRRRSVVATAFGSFSPSFPPYRSNSDPSAAPAAAAAAGSVKTAPQSSQSSQSSSSKKQVQPTKSSSSPPLLSCLVYAVVNVVIAVPSLYGYAAVIFKHPIFHPYRNQLAKLVISSSLIHQLGFTMFSSMPFAIGMVQDAGLVFLSAMSGTIADRVLLHRHHNHKNGSSDDDKYDHHDTNEYYDDNDAAIVLSTTLVLLSLGTAVLGLILMVLGKFRLANAVSFLPFGTLQHDRRKYFVLD